MKRIYIAALLLAAVASASVFELFFVRNTADSFTERIKTIDMAIEKKSLNDANLKIAELSNDWSKTVEKIDVLLIHDYVDSIGLSIAKMQSYLKRKNLDLYYAESESAKKGLASIKGSEYPNLENIL